MTVKQVRFDGELFANNTLKTELAKMHIMAEPTGAYNSAQNGKAESSIKLIVWLLSVFFMEHNYLPRCGVLQYCMLHSF